MRKFLFLFLLTGSLWAQYSPLVITPLTDNFYIYTTWQDAGGGFGLFPANGMYVVTDSGVIMIDTPWDVNQTRPLLDSIREKHHQEVKLCVVTHFHNDRTAGLDILKTEGIDTYSSVMTFEQGKAKGEKLARFQFSKDTLFQLGGIQFETFYPGEGHTPDNIVIWFPKAKVLFGGCFIKSTEAKGLGNIEDANISSWPQSVRKTIKKFRSPRYVIPGHMGWQKRTGLMHTLYLLQAK